MLVIKTIERVKHEGAYGGFVPWVLPTEFLLDGTNLPRPEKFNIMRGGHADLYQYWGEWLNYSDLFDRHTASGERFPGTGHFQQAAELELWQDYGDDGHTVYEHMGTYLVNATAEELALSGSEISSVLRDAVEDYKKREEAK